MIVKCLRCEREHNTNSMTMILVCNCHKHLIWGGEITKDAMMLQKKRPAKRDVIPNGLTSPEREAFFKKKYPQ